MDNNEKDNYDPFVGYVREKFQQAETSRLQDEKRWLQAYRNYRGLYGPEMAFRDSEKSKVFVKVTKTKVLAAFGQIIEVLFSSGKFPIGVTPTSMPEGSSEYAYLDPRKKNKIHKKQNKKAHTVFQVMVVNYHKVLRQNL